MFNDMVTIAQHFLACVLEEGRVEASGVVGMKDVPRTHATTYID